MASAQVKHSNFITDCRMSIEQFMAAYEQLIALKGEYVALGYDTSLTEDDFYAENDHMTVAILGGAFFSLETIKGLMDSGHATNLYKVTG